MQANIKADSPSTQAAAACLAGVALVQAIAALSTDSNEENAIGACVCIIAFLHYSWMTSASDDKKIELRYSDWYVTCPLLLWELHNISGQSCKSTLILPVLAVCAMLAFGHMAELQKNDSDRLKLFTIGCIAFAVCVASFVANTKTNALIVYGFFAIWCLYPVASWLRNNSMMDVLDIISKGLFGLFVAAKSFERKIC